MIGDILLNLVNRIKTVPAFEGRVGAVAGGTSQDPELKGSPVPFAWVVFVGSQNLEPERGAAYQQELYSFGVMIGISYGGDETEFITTHIPILEEVPRALLGISPHKYADQWNYEGCSLDSAESDRLIYRLTFSVVGHIDTRQ